MGINLVAGLWGLAEAIFFFIVPDVWLSIVGRKKLSVGIIACLYSLLGALLGGVVMYLWGSSNQLHVNQFLEKIPAINTEMIKGVITQLQEQGLVAVLLGPLSGTPYKIYAGQAAGQEINLLAFMLISIPARLVRFMLITTFFHYALKGVSHVIGKEYGLKLLLFSWFGFYVLYFSLKGL